MARRVKEDLFPALTWPQRAAAWKEQEHHLRLEVKALGEQLDEEYALRERAEAEVRSLKAELSRARKRIKELEKAHREEEVASDGSASKLPSFVKDK
jgi:septation ring formation regulator EzrA